MRRKKAGWMIAATVGLLLSGCMTQQATVCRDGRRIRVEFENRTAARLFHEALRKMPDLERSEDHSTEEAPFGVRDDARIGSGRNSEFNDAVALCDFNHDGIITESEARIFNLLVDAALVLERLDSSSKR